MIHVLALQKHQSKTTSLCALVTRNFDREKESSHVHVVIILQFVFPMIFTQFSIHNLSSVGLVAHTPHRWARPSSLTTHKYKLNHMIQSKQTAQGTKSPAVNPASTCDSRTYMPNLRAAITWLIVVCVLVHQWQMTPSKSQWIDNEA
jgi:hypothetical protein